MTLSEKKSCLPLGWFSLSRSFYVRRCVNFTFANKIEAVYERSHASVKVEPRSTSHLISTLYMLPLFRLKLTCVNVRSQKRVSGNQPLLVPAPWDELERSLGTRLGQPSDGIWNEFVRAGYNWNITWSVHNFSQIKLNSMIGAQRVLCFFIRLSMGNALFESWSRYSVK